MTPMVGEHGVGNAKERTSKTVFVDSKINDTTRVSEYLEEDGWRVISSIDAIVPCCIALVSVMNRHDLPPWERIMRFGEVRGIAVGNGADTDLVIEALSSGFDQFVDQAISERLLLARVRSIGRRQAESTKIEPGFVLNPKDLSLTVGDRSITLSPSEFAILLSLSQRVGSVVSKKILTGVSGSKGSDSLDSLVRRVRSKLEDLEGIRRIRSIRGFGFILDEHP